MSGHGLIVTLLSLKIIGEDRGQRKREDRSDFIGRLKVVEEGKIVKVDLLLGREMAILLKYSLTFIR